MGRHVTRIAAALAATLATAAGVAYAQGYFAEGSYATRPAPEQMPDASFVVCRLAYRSVRSEPGGIGWGTDHPHAESNLTTRPSGLAKAPRSRDAPPRPQILRRRPARKPL